MIHLPSQRRFVPRHALTGEPGLLQLKSFLSKSRRLFVVTGAGVSTESGIQDYRSDEVGLYATTNHRPTRIAEFLRSPEVRRRYWARNTVAWPQFRAFTPNISHHFLAVLEHRGQLHWLVTQNVDRLHHKAGSTRVTELHGTTFTVTCLTCHNSQSRDELQACITAENPGWNPKPEGFAPDADVFVSDDAVRNFCAPTCQQCGGILKPDVVFFGDSVPRVTVEFVNRRLAEADACLVVGTSLQTYSAYRHVRQAHDLQLPIAIVNIGTTRANGLEDVRLFSRCGEVFQKLLDSWG